MADLDRIRTAIDGYLMGVAAEWETIEPWLTVQIGLADDCHSGDRVGYARAALWNANACGMGRRTLATMGAELLDALAEPDLDLALRVTAASNRPVGELSGLRIERGGA